MGSLVLIAVGDGSGGIGDKRVRQGTDVCLKERADGESLTAR